MKLSKRETWKEIKEHNAAKVLKRYFPFIPVRYLGGWDLSAREIKGQVGTEAAFEAHLSMLNIAHFPKIYLYHIAKQHLTPNHTELNLTWDASLGDFDTGLIGDPISIELKNEEIESGISEVMNIIEHLGVTAEVRKGLDERGIKEKIKPAGTVQGINFTILFPNQLFSNFIMEFHQPRYIFAQLPPVTDLPREPFYYIELALVEGGIKVRVSMPDNVIDPKLVSVVGEYQKQKIINRMDEFNKLIEPIKNTIAKANNMIDTIRDEHGRGATKRNNRISRKPFCISKRARLSKRHI